MDGICISIRYRTICILGFTSSVYRVYTVYRAHTSRTYFN